MFFEFIKCLFPVRKLSFKECLFLLGGRYQVFWGVLFSTNKTVLNHFLCYNDARGTAQTIFAERNDFACHSPSLGSQSSWVGMES